MKIKQVRNATLVVEFGGTTFLVDPMLAEQGAYPGLPGTANSEKRNPLVGLKTEMAELLDVDSVIVTHTHPDHWDEAAQKLLPKDLPILAQHEADAELIRSSGFTNVGILGQDTTVGEVTLSKTPGQHGSDVALQAAGEVLGQVCGVVFRHPDEKTLYIAGDTVWNDMVVDNLQRYDPEVVVLNCGDAQIPGLGSIIMNKDDVATVAGAVPRATLIASHMEAVNHCLLSRAELRAFVTERGIADRVLVPEDDEDLTF